MDSLIVTGGSRAHGKLRISGSKNATLPIMAACLLTDQECVLHHVPELDDVKVMQDVLCELGAKVKREKERLIIDASNINAWEIPERLSRKMRASNLVMGPLLSRFGKATISYPGGCAIGQRPMDLHIKGLRQMGFEIVEERGYIAGRGNCSLATEILLDFPSVGATENLMMAAVLGNKTTVIRNAAREPEIVDLQNFLNRMGARIRGAGTDAIRIEGVKKLAGVEHEVIPDRIEAGTYMVLAAITQGDVVIENVVLEHIGPIVAKLREVGVEITCFNGHTVRVIGSRKLNAVDIKTMPYPGFPTDMQPQMMALLTTADGTSVIVETVFENRFMHVSELRRMGAEVKIEGRVAIIKGPKKLKGTVVEATDLRAGAALVLAGAGADGRTVIEKARHIYRGYENMVQKMLELGIDISSC